MSVRSHVAALLRRAADELEPRPSVPTAESTPAPARRSDDPDGDLVAAMVIKLGHIRFEHYLRQALRRYHPEEPTAEA
jgi:hypothetical protein